MNNAVNILREGSMMKALTKLGIPIVIAMLIMAIYNVVDTFWVARLGTLPVAAVSVVFPISLLFLGIGLMFGVGGGVYISRLLGAKQVVKASQVASISVITSVMLAALMALVCNAFLPDILLFMGANEEMISLAESYGRLFVTFKPYQLTVKSNEVFFILGALSARSIRKKRSGWQICRPLYSIYSS